MKEPDEPLSVADQIMEGLGDALLYARGELDLRTSVVEVDDPLMSPREIVRLRQSQGLDQRTFALVIDVSERTLKCWERGERRPSPASVNKLLQVKAFAETPHPARRVASKNGKKTPSATGDREK